MAFGKVILLGEHAVVYGHPALAGALGRGVTAIARPVDAGVTRLTIPAWSARVSCDDPSALGHALRVLVDGVGAGDRPFHITADAQLPPGAGLGSSAALSVAVVRALAEALGTPLGDTRTEDLANRAEACFHHNPSGVDVALAARGGLGVFRRGVGLEPIAPPPEPLTLAIGFSPEKRITAEMVDRVAEHRARHEYESDHALGELGAAALTAAAALSAGQLDVVGKLFDRAHELLRFVGVSTPTLDRMCELARGAGALGAKLTGAGGGGAVIALAPGRERRVVDAWRGAGFEAMATTVGAEEP